MDWVYNPFSPQCFDIAESSLKSLFFGFALCDNVAKRCDIWFLFFGVSPLGGDSPKGFQFINYLNFIAL